MHLAEVASYWVVGEVYVQRADWCIFSKACGRFFHKHLQPENKICCWGKSRV